MSPGKQRNNVKMKNQVINLFPQRLKQVRRSRKMTQKDLAKELNFGVTTIANYEGGIYEPSIQDLKAISELLNCSLDYLFGISDVMLPSLESKRLVKFLDIFKYTRIFNETSWRHFYTFANYLLYLQGEEKKGIIFLAEKYNQNPILK